MPRDSRARPETAEHGRRRLTKTLESGRVRHSLGPKLDSEIPAPFRKQQNVPQQGFLCVFYEVVNLPDRGACLEGTERPQLQALGVNSEAADSFRKLPKAHWTSSAAAPSMESPWWKEWKTKALPWQPWASGNSRSVSGPTRARMRLSASGSEIVSGNTDRDAGEMERTRSCRACSADFRGIHLSILAHRKDLGRKLGRRGLQREFGS